MTDMFLKKIDKSSLQLFLISFGFGTGLFIGGLTTQSLLFSLAGIFFILGATVINTILLIFNLINAIFSKPNRSKLLLGCLVLLLNIPITWLYLFIILKN
jgi:hypothetical protein